MVAFMRTSPLKDKLPDTTKLIYTHDLYGAITHSCSLQLKPELLLD